LFDYVGAFIKVIVASEYLTNENPAIISRNIWGNDYYSSDSDIVCILQHAGILKLQELPPNYSGLAVYFKVSRSRSNYASHFRNGIRSRKNQSFEGHSLKFETAIELQDLGNEENLKKLAAKMPTRSREIKRKQKQTRKALEEEQDMSIVFNLSGEPINWFNLGEFGDKRSVGLKVSERIETEVLYLETSSTDIDIKSMPKRYELSYINHKKNSKELNIHLQSSLDAKDWGKSSPLYQIKEVLNPLLKDLHYLKSKGVPLPDEDVKPIFTDLKWSEFLWGNKSLIIKAREDNPEQKDFKIPYINGYLYVSNE
jgi:hypothetical protein